jgi:protein SCO1/2
MEEYTQSFDQRIIGLTGTEPEIDAAAHAYGAYYIRHINGPDAQHYLIDHSTYIYLMNPQGQFIRAFDAGASGDSVAAAVGEEVNPVKQAAQINDGGLN